jgi:hypothetical protein
MNWENKNAYRGLVGQREGRRLLEKPRCRGRNKLKMGLKGIDRIAVYSQYLVAQDGDQWRTVVSTVMELWVA